MASKLLLPELAESVAMHQGRICGKRILLAEDEQGVREAIKMLLSLDEHIVSEAANGREALDLFTHGQFDLVITDYSMPGMAGDELALKIKRVTPTQPILMISAYAPELAGLEKPVDALLGKPFRFEDLRRVIADLLS